MTPEARIKDLEYQIILDRDFYQRLYNHASLEKDDRLHVSLRVTELDAALKITDIRKAHRQILDLKETLLEIYELMSTVGPEHCSQEIVDLITKALA